MPPVATLATFSLPVAFFYYFNVGVGSGFLGFPYVLFHSGLLAGVVALLTVAFFSAVTALWIVEATFRGQVVLHSAQNDSERTFSSSSDHDDEMSNRKLEINELCALFVGNWARVFFTIIISISVPLILWAYGALAASAWSSNIPFDSSTFGQCDDADFRGHQRPSNERCWNSYALCVLFFGCIVVPLSCMEIKEHKVMQLVLGAVRFVMIVSMSIYSLVGEIEHLECVETRSSRAQPNRTVDECREVWTSFHIERWIVVFPVTSYAYILHFAIPTLMQQTRDKKRSGVLVIAVFVVTTCLYVLVGVSVAVRYKDQVVETCSLSWIPMTKSSHSFIERSYAYLVVLYPSLDILSAYPLIVTFLTNILLADYKQLTKTQPTKSMRIVGRFIIATVPLIGALFLSNLVQVTTYTGILSVSIYLLSALIQYKSKRLLSAMKTKNDLVTNCSDDEEPLISTSLSVKSQSSNVFGGNVMVGLSVVFALWLAAATIGSWFV